MVYRVVVVDDEADVRDAYRAFFSRQDGFDVVGEADNGQDCVNLHFAQHPDITLIDLRMPIMSGIDAIAVICSREPSACLVALTTFGTFDMIVGALQAGASGYLMKDTGSDELVTALHEAMAGSMPLSAAVRKALVTAMVGQAIPSRQAPPITPRESDVLKCLTAGLSNQQIAAKLYLGEGTIKQYLNRLGDKLGAHSRIQILVRALQLRLVTGPFQEI